MERTWRILDRFPSFYKTWDRTSLVFHVVSALGKRVDEAEKDLFAIMRGHWVDKALRIDLDNLGALYNIGRKPGENDSVYRNRLKRAIIEFKGGGTISALQSSLKAALGLPLDYPLELVENPPREMRKELKVRTGETWWQTSKSISDATMRIEISVVNEGVKITNPTITNLDTGETVTFNGTIHSGEQLKIEEGKGFLNGVDVSEELSSRVLPKLLRRGATLRYSELLKKEIGIFDSELALFDQSMFAVDIPMVRIILTWLAYQPATFEVRIPREAVSMKGGAQIAQEVVDSIKASGVRGIIKYVEG